jgi:DNA segregation ATPase FtsK/SpoIIIE, S-DNA-T family
MVSAPRPPEIPPPHRFPIVATLSPIIASAVLFVVTKSAFTLVFALMGPIIAIASAGDSALQRRRARKRENVRFENDLVVARGQIRDAHVAERTILDAATPGVHQILREIERAPSRWRAASENELMVRIGSGTVASALVYDSTGRQASSGGVLDPELDARLAELRRHALHLAGAPITADAGAGLGVVGTPTQTAAVVRGIALQLASVLSPETTTVAAPEAMDWEWLSDLPHPRAEPCAPGSIVFRRAAGDVRVASAHTITELPRDVGLLLELERDGSARLASHRGTIHVEFVALETATAAARALADLARRLGISAAGGGLPEALELNQLPSNSKPSPGTLTATIGVAETGPLEVDLVTDGPHAIIAGTTGSGKSELLLSWVLAIAGPRSPTAVTFLFVDFKGGASFGPLALLPHCVGVITDLDVEQSLRALASLAAELRARERTLAQHGLRSIDDARERLPFPRLIVVVDEYAALVETSPDLHRVFADIAARGRSLGVHLVLCTQRPAGVVRDGILANCALRVSLRVMNAADSSAVLGTDAAVSLPPRIRGRALVSVAGDSPTLFQVARSSDADAAAVAALWAGESPVRVPWLPPLAPRIPLDHARLDEEPDSVPFAMCDLPEEQRQEPARFRPREHGSLLVVGAAGTGKSGVLAALAAAPSGFQVEQTPRELPRLWDALERALTTIEDRPRLLLFDDLDASIAGCQDSYQAPLVELLSRLLREGPARGVHCVLTAQRITGMMQGLATLCGAALLLRMPNRQEHVLAGGDAAGFVAALPPGAGHWRGHRIQVFAAPAAAPSQTDLCATTLDLVAGALAVVSSRPEQIAEAIRLRAPGRRVIVLTALRREPQGELRVSAGGAPDILVADPDVWQSQWSLFTALHRSTGILFDGCSLAEFRTLARSRELPPPFARGESAIWLLLPDGEVTRARLPGI